MWKGHLKSCFSVLNRTYAFFVPFVVAKVGSSWTLCLERWWLASRCAWVFLMARDLVYLWELVCHLHYRQNRSDYHRFRALFFLLLIFFPLPNGFCSNGIWMTFHMDFRKGWHVIFKAFFFQTALWYFLDVVCRTLKTTPAS